MKTIITAMLYVSIISHAFAQKLIQSEDIMTNSKVNSCYQIELGQKERMVIHTRYTKDIEKIKNLDSLLKLFNEDYKKVQPVVSESTDALSFKYELLENGQRRLTMNELKDKQKQFQFHNNLAEPAQIKYLQDTLFISVITPGRHKSSMDYGYPELSVKLIVNNIDNIEKRLKTNSFNKYIAYLIDDYRNSKRYDLQSEKFRSIYLVNVAASDSSLRTAFRRIEKRESPFFAFHQTFGVGVFRNQLVPNSQTELAFIPSKYHNVGYTLGWRSMFFTERNDQTGNWRTLSNGVLQVGFTFYDFKRNQSYLEPYGGVDTGHVLFGAYLGRVMTRNGDIFEPNTWNLSMTVAARGIVKVQPEVYFNGFFKNAMPGIRVQMGF
ncbi:MAG: hypothetical protein EAZ50_12125 [Runella slithyformis]|nr:MAG: hypothetical protein EAZ50_12125 [Runella slithyformis]